MSKRKSRRYEQRILEVIGTPREVLERHGIKVRGRKSRCPFHDDHHPSLYLYTNFRGALRWRCYAGCGCGDALVLEARLSHRSMREVIDAATRSSQR